MLSTDGFEKVPGADGCQYAELSAPKVCPFGRIFLPHPENTLRILSTLTRSQRTDVIMLDPSDDHSMSIAQSDFADPTSSSVSKDQKSIAPFKAPKPPMRTS